MKKALGGIVSLGLVFSSVSPAVAATMLDKDLAQFSAGGSSPTLDFQKGSSKVYENGNLYIVTDDQIYLNAPVATNVQDDLNVGANLRVTGTGIYTGTQTFNGSVTLGNEATDVITATGYFTQARIGTGTVFGHIGTVGPDELGVEGAVEIDGAAWLDGALTVAGATSLGDGLDVDDALGIGYVATLHQTAVGTASGEVASLLLQNDGGDGTNDYLVVGKNASATVFSVKSETGDTAISGALAVNGATTLGNLAADLITVTGTLSGVSPLKLGGATDNTFEMTVTLAAEPTADVVITIPDITGTLVTTGDTDSVSDAMVVDTITASNYLPLAGGTLAGQVVFYNAAVGSGTTEGSVYYSTADDNLYVYADGGWVDLTAGAAGATSLDTAYNTDAGERTIVVDDGAVSWDMSGAHSFIVDIQGTGSFVVQHDSVAAFTLADGGAATIAGSAEGTAALTLTAGDLIVTDGDLTLSGGEIAATSDDATGNNFAFTTAATTGVGMYVNGSTVTQGDAIKATIASATMTTGKALNLYDGVTSIFSVADDGATVVKGTAEGTTALTLTTGDLVVTDGDLTVSGGELSATTGATTGVGHQFNIATVTSGQGFRITYDESAMTTGTIIEAYGNDDSTVDWSVGDHGVTVIRGVAEGTAALTLTAGDVVVTDGDITVTAGEVSVTTDDTDADAFTINGNTLTTGQTLALTYDNSTHSGNIFEISDNDDGVDFAVADDGVVTLTGAAEGTTVMTLTAGDLVVTNGDLTLSSGEIAATSDDTTGNNFAFTAAATTGVGFYVNGATVTGGDALKVAVASGTMTTGKALNLYDGVTSIFSVADDGATVIKGTAENTAVLTLTTGDLVVTDGDLTISSGEVAFGSNGVGADFTFYTGTAGESWIWDDTKGNVTVTNTAADTVNMNLIDLKVTDNTSTSGDVIGISLSQESGSGAGLAAGIDVVNNDDTAMTIGERIRAVTGNITTALQIIASAGKTITDAIQIGDGDGTITDGIDISSATTMTNAINVGPNKISGTTYTLEGTTSVISFTDFGVTADGLMTFASDSAGDQITVTSPAGDHQTLVAAAALNTSTAGIIDLNITAGDAAVVGADINLTQNDLATAAVDATAQNITLTANDADGDMFGIKISAGATANAAGGSYEAGILIDNAEDTAASMTDAIKITATTDTATTDAIDASDAEIDNALNMGANAIVGTYFGVAATGAVTLTPSAVGTVPLTVTGIADSTAVIFDLNLKPVSGTVMDMDVAAATTQAGALVGVDMDFSTNITNAAQNQTGVKLTMKDGSGGGTALGLDIDGTVDYAIDTSGISAGTDLRLNNSETIANSTDATFTLGRDDAGAVTVTAADDDATAALTVTPGGAEVLTLGSASVTQIDMITDAASATDVNVTGSITTSTSVSATTFVSATTYMAADAYRVTNASALTAATNDLTKANMQAASFWPVSTAGNVVDVDLDEALDAGDVGRKLVFALTTAGNALTVSTGTGITVTTIAGAGAAVDAAGDFIECLIMTTATATCVTYAQ